MGSCRCSAERAIDTRGHVAREQNVGMSPFKPTSGALYRQQCGRSRTLRTAAEGCVISADHAGTTPRVSPSNARKVDAATCRLSDDTTHPLGVIAIAIVVDHEALGDGRNLLRSTSAA
jgi:hypothetical protein